MQYHLPSAHISQQLLLKLQSSNSPLLFENRSLLVLLPPLRSSNGKRWEDPQRGSLLQPFSSSWVRRPIWACLKSSLRMVRWASLIQEMWQMVAEIPCVVTLTLAGK